MVRAVREDKEAGELVAMEEADPGLQGLAAGSRKKTKTATARIKPEKSLSSPRPWHGRRLWVAWVRTYQVAAARGGTRGRRENPREALSYKGEDWTARPRRPLARAHGAAAAATAPERRETA